jgi:hypothetical protein
MEVAMNSNKDSNKDSTKDNIKDRRSIPRTQMPITTRIRQWLALFREAMQTVALALVLIAALGVMILLLREGNLEAALKLAEDIAQQFQVTP